MSTQSLATPGQYLGPLSKHKPGPGTYVSSSQLFASIAGIQSTTNSNSNSAPSESGASTVTVSSAPVAATNVLPCVDAEVLARVTRITPRQATVAILVVGESVCADEFQGLIRVQDVRATEKDRVKIFESFRPGDIVRAQVISLGDQSSYYLSTASNKLGVIMATSEAGNAMYPISWKEFKDPVTGLAEPRKVAKPF